MFKFLFLPLLIIAGVFAAILISFGIKVANSIDPKLTQGVVEFSIKWGVGVVILWLIIETIGSILILWLLSTILFK